MPVAFTRLRIAGFKSFAEPVSLEIHPGLTGIIGPNGCGKSNVVEALRWAMGENSARSLRGGEMDDVIFAGTAHRASRNVAEAILSLELTEGLAPAPWQQCTELQISRQIERGSGSTYRVNGKEARARDVQTLLADLASGARSAAMVSQGKIGQLVNARPDERRAILEEAAGITGLHARRHEAELKLGAAETNLTRAEDLRGQLLQQLEGLKRQARQTARYRNISGLVRDAETDYLAFLHARASAAAEMARIRMAEATAALNTAEADAFAMVKAHESAELAIDEPKTREAVARSFLERIRIEAEGLEAEEERLNKALQQAQVRFEQTDLDVTEAAINLQDAEAAEAAIDLETAEINESLATLPDRLLQHEQKLEAAIALTREQLAEADRLTLAAAQAVAEADGAARALAEAEQRLQTVAARLDATQRDWDAAIPHILSPERRAAIGQAETEAASALAAAQQALNEAEPRYRDARQHHADLRGELAKAETTRREAEAAHQTAAATLARLRDDLDRLTAEHQATEAAQIDDADVLAAKHDCDAAQTELDTAVAALQHCETTLAEAVAALASAQQARNEQATMRRQTEEALTAAAASVQRIRAQHETLSAEHASVSRQRAEAGDAAALEKRVQDAAAEIESVAAALLEAETAHADAAQAGSDALRAVQSAEADALRIATDIEALEQQRGRLQGQIETIDASYRDAKEALKVFETLEHERRAVAGLEAQLATAQTRREQTESAAAAAKLAADAARDEATRLAAECARLEAEIGGLAASLQSEDGANGKTALDTLNVPAGLEAALAAGLAEALEAGMEAQGHRFWHLLPTAEKRPFPLDAMPLDTLIETPPLLARALGAIGLIADDQDGAAAQDKLLPGQILVNRAGAAWRWDGYRSDGKAPAPAAQRLKARTRLNGLQDTLRQTTGTAQQARAVATEADAALSALTAEAQTDGAAIRQLENSVQAARETTARLAADAAQAEQSCALLGGQRSRLAEEAQILTDQWTALTEKQAAAPKIDSLQARHAELSAQIAQHADRQQALKSQRQTADATLRAAQADHLAHRSSAAEADARLAALTPQITRLADDLERAQLETVRLEAVRETITSVETLDQAVKAAESRSTADRAAEQGARARRAACEATVAERKIAASTLISRAEDAKARLAALAERLPAAQSRLADATDEARQRNGTLEALPDIQIMRETVAIAATEEASAATMEETARGARTAAEKQVAAHRQEHAALLGASQTAEAQCATLKPQIAALTDEKCAAETTLTAAQERQANAPDPAAHQAQAAAQRTTLDEARQAEAGLRQELSSLQQDDQRFATRLATLTADKAAWQGRSATARDRLSGLEARLAEAQAELNAVAHLPEQAAQRRAQADERLRHATEAHQTADNDLTQADRALRDAADSRRHAEIRHASARETIARAEGAMEQAALTEAAVNERVVERLGEGATLPPIPVSDLTDSNEERARKKMERLTREREEMGPVNLRADIEVDEVETRIAGIDRDRDELQTAIAKLRGSIGHLNREGRERLNAVFAEVDGHFQTVFARMFGGGKAHLAMVGSDDPLLAGLEIYVQPPGKKLATLSLLSGGEQALTALSLIFAVFRCNPAPICVLDEVDAPLDDANVDRFCMLLTDVSQETGTRFLVVTHHQHTMARMDRLYGVTMQERGVSRVLSVDLAKAVEMVEPV